jgi:hypothetical protein
MPVLSYGKLVDELLNLVMVKAESGFSKASESLASVHYPQGTQLLPEELMLRTANGDSPKQRAEADHASQWFNFFWGILLMVLDVVRNSFKLEHCYQKAAFLALDFCKQYGRKREPQRLGQLLSNHAYKMSGLKEISPGRFERSQVLDATEAAHTHLEVRLRQIEVSMSMGFFDLALQAAEDFHIFRTNSSVPIRSSVMRIFYELLAELLWKCNNYTLHSLAHYKLLQLRCLPSKVPPSFDEVAELTTRIVLSALCITPSAPDLVRVPRLRNINEAESGRVKLFAELLGPFSAASREDYVELLVCPPSRLP